LKSDIGADIETIETRKKEEGKGIPEDLNKTGP
jgi:hypothetical protein